MGIRPNPTVRLSFVIELKNDLRVAVVDRANEFDPRQFQLVLRTATRDARSGKGRLAMATRLIEILPVPVVDRCCGRGRRSLLASDQTPS